MKSSPCVKTKFAKCTLFFAATVQCAFAQKPTAVSLPSATPPSYTFSFFDAPGICAVSSPNLPNLIKTDALGVNDAHQVVGSTCNDGPINPATSSSTGIGFLLDGTSGFQQIIAPWAVGGAGATVAWGINNLGDVVGLGEGSSGPHGFKLSQGIYSFIDSPAATGGFTLPKGINNHGQIVGFYTTTPPGCCSSSFNHGFLYSNGIFQTIDDPNADNSSFPAFPGTMCAAINDLGQIVGTYYDQTDHQHGFLLDNGVFTTIDPPGSTQTFLNGINDAGQIVGNYADSTSSHHSFIWSGGIFTEIQIPNATGVSRLGGINNRGDLVGSAQDAVGVHAFLATLPLGAVTLVDPVPSLLGGPFILPPDTPAAVDALATAAALVHAVGADGVTEILVKIPALKTGDQLVVTLFNDQTPAAPSTSPEGDGALGRVGDTSFAVNSVTASALNTIDGPMGFAVYRAPLDFVRSISGTGACGGAPSADENLGCRSVSLEIQYPDGSKVQVPIIILRPPVVLIHGIWDDSSTWNSFSPLFNSGVADARFSIGRADYSYPVGPISATTPVYSGTTPTTRSNSLGFQYNAPRVLSQIQGWIESFKSGNNPAGLQAAAIQADIVAHSMGGDIARTLPLQPSFLSNNTFGQGNVHKVITIDTPHLGTPLVIRLFENQNTCVRNELASRGNVAFESVTLSGRTITGAAGDLQGDGSGVVMSEALKNIAAPGLHPLPTAMISAVIDSNNLNSLGIASLLHLRCLVDPLAQDLTPTRWPTVFGQPSDAIVPLSSQLNGLSPGTATEEFGFVHSVGTEALGFAGPSVLPSLDDLRTFPAATNIATDVIMLLNTPVTSAKFNFLNP